MKPTRNKTLPPANIEAILNAPPVEKRTRKKKRPNVSTSKRSDWMQRLSNAFWAMMAATVLTHAGPSLLMALGGLLLALNWGWSYFATPQPLPRHQPNEIAQVPRQYVPAHRPTRIEAPQATQVSRPRPTLSPQPPVQPPSIELPGPDTAIAHLEERDVIDRVPPSVEPVVQDDDLAFGDNLTLPDPQPDMKPEQPTVGFRVTRGILGSPFALVPVFGSMPPTIGPDSKGSLGPPIKSSRIMQDMISVPGSEGPNSENQPFTFRSGIKYVGTSQQPGQASKRVQLSILSVKDHGTNVTARMQLIEGNRFSRNYEGFIEQNPLRLVLTPVASSNGFSAFLTYQPWHSQSPTPITLQIDSDKGLSGTSASSEEFHLMADRSRPQPKAIASVSIDTPRFGGFDLHPTLPTAWKLVRKNKDAVEQEEWIFKKESKQFVWNRSYQVIATGTYTESLDENSVDLVVTTGKGQVTYAGIVVPAQDANRVEVCLPINANGRRPQKLNATNTNTFELVREP